MRVLTVAAVLLLLLASSCATGSPEGRSSRIVQVALREVAAAPLVDRVAHAARDAGTFETLRRAFVGNNPGYDLAWHASVRGLAPVDCDRIVFVQGPGPRTAAPTVGDVLLLRSGERWDLEGDGAISLLAFHLPEPLPAALPRWIRPDWDPQITDTPGGCATEGDAYRRILLTWKPEVGSYILHALNAHRVRIHNSFSHYHPVDGGFDEFYLVQQAPPGARLLTSDQVPAIEARSVDRQATATLLQSRPLHAGDLVYLPRGTMHRGLGGALVQVISVPGFVPKSEIGVDHHLWAINKQLALRGAEALPFHVIAARTQVIK